jgi:hypothetical protein
VDLAAYLGTVTALVTLSLGAFYFLTTQLGGRLDRQDTRFDRMDSRFDRMDSRFDRLESRFDRIDDKVDRLYDAVANTDARISTIEHRLD